MSTGYFRVLSKLGGRMRMALSNVPSGIGTRKNSGARVTCVSSSRSFVFDSSTLRGPLVASCTSDAAAGSCAVEYESTIAEPSGATLTVCVPASMVTRISVPPRNA